MASVRLDTRFPLKREIITLSNQAFRLHISAICWTAQYSTAGVIPVQCLGLLSAGNKRARSAAAELVDRGLWEQLPNKEYRVKPGGYTVDRDPSYDPGQRERIYTRDGHRCVECGETDDLTLDHIHPRALAGDDSDENLRTLCRPCNSRKGARI